MDTKATSIVAYLTWIGLLLAILAGDVFPVVNHSLPGMDLGNLHGGMLDHGTGCSNQPGRKRSSAHR